MKTPESLSEIIEYFTSPLEAPELYEELYTKPEELEIDKQVNELIEKAKLNGGSRERGSFSLLDSTVIIPPLENKYITAYFQEAVLYGDFVDLYVHSTPLIKYKDPQIRRPSTYYYDRPDRSDEYRRRNSIKALNKIRQLTLQNFSNDYVKLLTLTFGDCDFDITDPKICNKLLSKFLQKLRKLYPNFKYLGVIEFQKRGAVHYHILCDLPFIDKEKLASLWSYGFIDIRKPDYVIGTYLFKYLAKDINDKKLKGIRVYFYSKNLEKPTKLTGKQAFDYTKGIKGQVIDFSNKFFNRFTDDVVKYRQFKLKPVHKGESDK